MQLKKSKTYKEQVEILRNTGLKINDSGNVSSFLNHVNYYRFSGYFLLFISKTDKKIHEDTSFEQLENIYYFDSELRKLIMGTIDEIEIYLKSQISYYHSQKYDAEGYTDSTINKIRIVGRRLTYSISCGLGVFFVLFQI